VPGTAVFLTSDPDIAPGALMHNIKHNHVLHERNIIVFVNMATRPFVSDAERIRILKLSDRFTRIEMTFGYMEETNVPKALALARKQGEKFDIMSTSFFLNRRTFRTSKTQGCRPGRSRSTSRSPSRRPTPPTSTACPPTG
jgi:KUP system potassium uptake protein